MVDVLTKYIPHHAVEPIIELLKKHQVHLKIVPQRKSRHGDYRLLESGQHQITVNASLNQYKFLMTLVHEIAHLVAIKTYGRHIQSHGKEWKYVYQKLMLPFLRPEIFPKILLPTLAEHFRNPTASSDTDARLNYSLMKFDADYENKTYVHQIPNGSVFKTTNGKTFQKVGLKVKRYLCKEISTERLYLINANAEVLLLK